MDLPNNKLYSKKEESVNMFEKELWDSTKEKYYIDTINEMSNLETTRLNRDWDEDEKQQKHIEIK